MRGELPEGSPKMITVNKAFSNVVIKMIEDSGDLIHLRARWWGTVGCVCVVLDRFREACEMGLACGGRKRKAGERCPQGCCSFDCLWKRQGKFQAVFPETQSDLLKCYGDPEKDIYSFASFSLLFTIFLSPCWWLIIHYHLVCVQNLVFYHSNCVLSSESLSCNYFFFVLWRKGGWGNCVFYKCRCHLLVVTSPFPFTCMSTNNRKSLVQLHLFL